MAVQNTPVPVARVKGGQFAPGQSGNVAGKRSGTRNKTTLLCEGLIGDDAALVMAKCIALAKEGDSVALRLVIERLVPIKASRDRSVVIELPQVSSAADLVAAAAAVIERAAAGDITLSEAREFLGLIEIERRILETGDLAIRIEVLEAQATEGSALQADAAALGVRIRRVVEDGHDHRRDPGGLR